MTDLTAFRFSMPIDVRFADIDALGHVNNATYLTYVEHARTMYVQAVCNWQDDWEQLGMIVARSEVDYRAPIKFGDTVTVYARIGRLGSKSFDMFYVITRQAKEMDSPQIAAEIKAILVTYDYKLRQSVPISEQWRTAITAYEPMLD